MKAAPILLFTAATIALSTALYTALYMTLGTAPARAETPASMPEQSFTVKTPDPPRAKTQTVTLSILDQGVSDISRSLMLRLAYRQLFATDAAQLQGPIFSAHFHHLFGTNPAMLNRFVQAADAGIYPNFNELGIGAGYRWAYENFAIIPQAHFRDMMAFGKNRVNGGTPFDVNQHLIGFEPGLRLEYWLYPEVARLSVDYGFNVPFVHLANQSSNISPFSLSLHRVYTELSYRLLGNIDLNAGFYWWQVPSQMGTGSITDTTVSNITGFQIGGGLVF